MQRNFGLDLIRSFAILLVLAAHISPFFLNNKFIFQILYNSGLYGVEFFFILSGYLIGITAFKKLLPEYSFKTVRAFIVRRVLRVVPAYYFILLLLVFIDLFSTKSGNVHLLHFLFLQNFSFTEHSFFGVAWALPLEIWFYIVFPLALLPVCKTKKPLTVLTYLFMLILFTIITRAIYVFIFNPSFDFGVRKSILFRFDVFLIGATFAYIRLKYLQIYNLLSQVKFFLSAVISLIIFYGIVVFVLVNFGISYFDHSNLIRILSWPFMGIMIGLIIIYMTNNKFINRTITTIKPIRTTIDLLSTHSYTIYLIHYPIYTFFENNHVFKHRSISIIVSTVIIVLASSLLYNLVEKPLILKRNQLVKL